MWWVVVLMGVFSYGFAIIGVEMIPPMDRVASNVVDELALAKFGTLADSTMSLLQIITLDDASEVYRPLIMLGTSRIFCALYFGCFIVIVAIAFMNLVTAAIVEESFSQAAQNKEMQQEVEHQRQRALIPRLREMFELIDLDGSGEVSWDEIKQSPIELQEELSRMTKTDDLYEIFQLLDDDNSGAVGIDEFLDGILKSMKSTSGDVTINLLIRKLMRQVASLSASKLA
jgi:Ca2+-binding EF-hand superfamily protein